LFQKRLFHTENNLYRLRTRLTPTRPRPVVKWFVNSKELIKSTAEFRIENPDQYTSQLVIEEIFPEDEGEYTCVVQNKFGMDQTSTELTVYGTRGIHLKILFSVLYFCV
jgi:hypothetical protein